MDLEIEFHPVGSGERSGDAISLRYGTPGDYRVMVYDGGTKDSGERLVAHIEKYYGTQRVDYVVCSHPDADHCSGLSVVLERLQIGGLWMHRPWKYSSIIRDYFKDSRFTNAGLAARLKDKMSTAYQLEELASKKKIPIYEPYCGDSIGNFKVLSPQRAWYVHELIPNFEKSPEQKEAKFSRLAFNAMVEAGQQAIAWIAEQWNTESLHEDVETTAENESSVVLLGILEGHGIMLTGDAGIRALSISADFAEANQISLPSALKFFQVPHHGSRHNVSPNVLDRILGPKKNQDDGVRTRNAFVSVGTQSTTHPRKSVVNSLIRRGTNVLECRGSTIRHFVNMPKRDHWQDLTPLSFSNEVEPWD